MRASIAQALRGLDTTRQKRVHPIPLACSDDNPKQSSPQFGWIRGNFGGGQVQLDFDRRQHTVTGESHGDRVQLSTDHDRGQIQGQAHGAPVELTQDWSPRRVSLQGWAQSARYQLTVDEDLKVARGQAGSNPIDLRFDREQGWIRGFSGRDSVDLRLDPSGALSGRWGGGSVQAEMINLDLGDFLKHLYLVDRQD